MSYDDDTVLIQPTSTHTHTVVLLRGRGSNAVEFGEEFFESACTNGETLLQHFPHIKWVLPCAPARQSTVFQELLTEWFDVYSLTEPEVKQELQIQGIRESTCQIQEIVQHEMQFVTAERIFPGGMSQGCAVAILALLLTDLKVAGFIGTSSWLPFATELQALSVSSTDTRSQKLLLLIEKLTDRCVGQKERPLRSNLASGSSTIPVLLCHGTDDHIVDISLGQRLRDILRDLGLSVIWEEHAACGHWIKEPDDNDAIADFLQHYTTEAPHQDTAR